MKDNKMIRFINNFSKDGFEPLYQYLISTRLGLVLYLFFTVVGYYIVYVEGIQKYCPGPYLPEYHKYLSLTVLCLGWLSWIKCCMSDPGVIKNE